MSSQFPVGFSFSVFCRIVPLKINEKVWGKKIRLVYPGKKGNTKSISAKLCSDHAGLIDILSSTPFCLLIKCWSHTHTCTHPQSGLECLNRQQLYKWALILRLWSVKHTFNSCEFLDWFLTPGVPNSRVIFLFLSIFQLCSRVVYLKTGFLSK